MEDIKAFLFRLLTILESGGYIVGFIGIIAGIATKSDAGLLGVGLIIATFIARVALNFLFNLPQWWDITDE